MEFTLDHLNKMHEGVKLFNEKKYWECHEALEDPWVENPSDKVRYVYWLVIQVAAMLVHYDKGNLTGMVGLYNKAMDKLKKCEEYNIENEFLEQSLNWSAFKKILKKIPKDFKQEDLIEIYNFKFPTLK
jgi:predicted metal-dependent hydrolase